MAGLARITLAVWGTLWVSEMAHHSGVREAILFALVLAVTALLAYSCRGDNAWK